MMQAWTSCHSLVLTFHYTTKCYWQHAACVSLQCLMAAAIPAHRPSCGLDKFLMISRSLSHAANSCSMLRRAGVTDNVKISAAADSQLAAVACCSNCRRADNLLR